MKKKKDSESLAIDILTFLTGISSRDMEKFPVLRKAIRAVPNKKNVAYYWCPISIPTQNVYKTIILNLQHLMDLLPSY